MSMHYSQDSKNSVVKLQQEGSALKSLVEEFWSQKILLLFDLSRLSLNVMINGNITTLRGAKQLEKRIAILEENGILKRTTIFLIV